MGGGSYEAPEIKTDVEPAKQVVKSVSAAAADAAQAQRERARKSRGLAGSILTGTGTDSSGTTLGA